MNDQRAIRPNWSVFQARAFSRVQHGQRTGVPEREVTYFGGQEVAGRTMAYQMIDVVEEDRIYGRRQGLVQLAPEGKAHL